jgi:predicted Zn-dependent peptidase
VTTGSPAAQQKPGTTRTLLSEDEGGLVRRTVLPGGLRVVTEAMPGVRSATIGVWVGVGSRDESPALAGASHFLEHLLFKGTPRRTAMDISVELDAVGGEFNSFAAHYADAGMFGVAVGCLPSKVDDVLSVVRTELERMAEDGITAEELERGKGQLRGGLVLGLEDSGSRMSRIAKAELLYDELPSLDEVIRRIDAVTVEDVQVLAKELFSQPETLAIVGPVDPLTV